MNYKILAMVFIGLFVIALATSIIFFMNETTTETQGTGSTNILDNLLQKAEWIVEGDKVYVDDANIYISAEPATMHSSGWVTFNLNSKVYTGDADFVFGFDKEGMKPKIIQIYKPEWVEKTGSYTCEGDFFNYTQNPKHAWCYETIDNNGTMEDRIMFDRDFDWADLPTETMYWNESYIQDWKDYSSNMNSIDYNYEGMNKWYYNKNVPIVQDTDYTFRVYMEMVPSSKSGKYWFAIKPSGETIQQAIANEHFYALDPWWSASWSYKKEINITTGDGNSTGNFSVLLDITYDANMQNDFDDLRFTNGAEDTELSYWFENNTYQDSTNVEVWVRVEENITSASQVQIYMYYGNAGVTTTSNISTAFLFGEDFNEATVDWVKWASNDHSIYSTSGGILTGTPGSSASLTKVLQSAGSYSNYVMTTRFKKVASNSDIRADQSGTALEWGGGNQEAKIQPDGATLAYFGGAFAQNPGFHLAPIWFRGVFMANYVGVGNQSIFYDNRTLNVTKAGTTGDTTTYPTLWSYSTGSGINVDWVHVRPFVHTGVSYVIGGAQSGDEMSPLFFNYLNDTANNTAYISGASYQFNVTINNTNGTAGLQFNGINFTATNISTFIFNSTVTELSAGSYNYYWWGYGNGSLGRFNSSEVQGYTIATATSTGEITNTTSWTIPWGLNITVGSTNSDGGNADVTYGFFRDDVSVGAGENVNLSAGTYIYLLNTTGGTNYSASASLDSETLIVSKATPIGTLTNSTSLTITLGENVTVSSTESNSGDSDVTYKLFNNNVEIPGGIENINQSATTSSNVFILNTTGGTNYSASASLDTFTVTVIGAVNSQTFNTSAFDLYLETFYVNVTGNGTLLGAELFYDGTSKGNGTNEGDDTSGYFSKQLVIPAVTVTKNVSFYWQLSFAGTPYANSSLNNVTVNKTVFGLCNSTNIVPYLNITFKNETTALEDVPASMPSSTWYYYGNVATTNKSFTFSNATENTNYAFCSNANRTVNTTYSLTYTNSYSQQRGFSTKESYTKAMTNKTLYLLPTSEGTFITFQVINVAESPISGVSANVTKGGVLVSSGTTDDAGSISFFLDQDTSYAFAFFKTGYPLYTTTLTPTSTTYTVTLGSGTATADTLNLHRGINYILKPTFAQILKNNTMYEFNLTLTSNFYTVTEWGFSLWNDTTRINTTSSTANGGFVSTTADTGNNDKIFVEFWWVILGNETTFNSTTYYMETTSGNGYGIKTLFTRFEKYSGVGMLGMETEGPGEKFTFSIILYLIMMGLVGMMTLRFGITSVTPSLLVIFSVVFIFDVGLGLFPQIGIISTNWHLPTIVSFLSLLTYLVWEANR